MNFLSVCILTDGPENRGNEGKSGNESEFIFRSEYLLQFSLFLVENLSNHFECQLDTTLNYVIRNCNNLKIVCFKRPQVLNCLISKALI